MKYGKKMIYNDNELIAVISALPNICPFFPEKKAFQIRGLAVIEKFRSRGIASALIKEIEITLGNKFSIEFTLTKSGFNVTSLNGITLEELGNPLTTGRNCTDIGKN